MDILFETLLDPFVTVFGFGDDFHVGLRVEHLLQARADDRVVVGDQDAGHEWDRHHDTPTGCTTRTAGTSRRTSIPFGEACLIASAAPMSRARSRMLRRPPCSSGFSVKPRPSSTTRKTTLSKLCSNATVTR